MPKEPMEKKNQEDEYTPLATEYNYLHSRTLEEFPDGPYGSASNFQLGKTTGWDTGEEVNPRFSYEDEQMHEASGRLDALADPVRTNPEGDLE